MGKGVNVMIANGSESKWSVKLDDEEQLSAIAQTLGCDLL
ncbi:phosphotransferase system IIA component [Vibrio cholerae HC-51A1]|nr:phosphotransferase system IIA component [Vibrio cholerae HC-02A1]EGS73869.1 phosphotransferase system IIA component [Vibrio cholerae BJG-01]EKG46293.1 phosphotransferase system IIA component [Vibrio cholerae HC-50A1]EKG56524.1 phosphotransferase system IIA component [Vibrio cholerae HC-55A1]EKG64298.1 phosphotransferase system IIA component [Vibrio cholerae HC-52A1]EKG64353.1 phosphotransferase system IIA component [Vibrio cholerae HC-56A1]EKG75935.1 phosphotransferase system IIA component